LKIILKSSRNRDIRYFYQIKNDIQKKHKNLCKIPVHRSILKGYYVTNTNKNNRVLRAVLPHKYERRTPWSETPKSLHFINQKKVARAF